MARRRVSGGGTTHLMHFACGRRADHIVTPYPSQSAPNRPMPIRIRKLIGAVALIVLVVTWSLLAMALAQLPVIKSNGVVEAIYFVVAGLAWVLPAMPLIKWMSVDGPRTTDEG